MPRFDYLSTAPKSVFLGSTATTCSFVPTWARHAAARRDSQGWPKAIAKRRASVLDWPEHGGILRHRKGNAPGTKLMVAAPVAAARAEFAWFHWARCSSA